MSAGNVAFVGYSGQILVARPGVEGDADVLLEAHGFGTVTAREDGWIEAELDPSWHEPDTDIERLVDDLEGPVLVADVTTSDFVIVTVAGPGVDRTDVILTPAAFRAEGVPLPSRADTNAAFEAFASWSMSAPRQVEAPALRALIKRGATLAEDLVWELLSMLGIVPIDAYAATMASAPSDVLRALNLDGLGGYLRPTANMTEPGGREWATERFLMGIGDGFVGVWDRRRPDGPLYRFEQTARGFDAALGAWADMTKRLELGDDADRFAGLVGIEMTGFFPGGRSLEPKHWRWIPGWGDGFAAVWDREAGAEPVVRFKGTSQRTKDRAVAWAREATMRLLASRKQLGPNRWICGHAEVSWDVNGARRSMLFLLAYEDADPIWPPHGVQGNERDGFVLHRVDKLPDGFDLSASSDPPSPDPEAAMARARMWQARGEWIRVPDHVPRTLFETARWAVEESPLAASLVPFRRP